jgi:RNA exonuclease 4
VTDARATMALYRLFKSEWESLVHRQMEAFAARTKARPLTTHHGKRKAGAAGEDDEGDNVEGGDEVSRGVKRQKKEVEFPGGGRKGVSSGLSVIVRRNGVRVDPPGRARARGGGEVAGPVVSEDAGNWWE